MGGFGGAGLIPEPFRGILEGGWGRPEGFGGVLVGGGIGGTPRPSRGILGGELGPQGGPQGHRGALGWGGES